MIINMDHNYYAFDIMKAQTALYSPNCNLDNKLHLLASSVRYCAVLCSLDRINLLQTLSAYFFDFSL